MPAVAAWLAYRNGFAGQMIFDDDFTIVTNRHLRTLGGFWAAAFGEPHSPLTNRLVPAISFALNFSLHELDVWGYHFVNLVCHAISGMLAWGLVARTLEAPNVDKRLAPAAPWLATIVAVLWVVHPLQTEAVEYLTQRTTLLMGLFMLATLYATACSWTSPRPIMWQAVAILCCALGMSSKEDMLAAPVLVVLYDATFFATNWRDAFRRHRGMYIALAATWLLLAVYLATGPANTTVGIRDNISITPWEYLLTQARAIGRYLWLSVWPRPLMLAYDWDVSKSIGEVWMQGIGILALLGLTGWGVLRRRWWGMLGAWFFLILAPTSSVLPIATEYLAERRMYLPLLSVIVLLVIGGYLALALLPGSAAKGARVIGGVVAIALAMACVQASDARVRMYADTLALWQDNLAKAPNSVRAHTNYGNALLKAGDKQAAIEEFKRAIAIDPNNANEANTNLSVLYQQLGQPQLAVAHGRAAAKGWAALPLAHVNLALALMDLGEVGEATSEADIAIKLAPNFSKAQNAMGIVLARQQRYAEAEPYFTKSRDLDRSDPMPYYNLAQMIVEQNRQSDGSVDPAAIDRAIEITLEGVNASRNDADGYQRLGNLYAQRGNLQGALQAFEKAAILRPRDENIRQNIATLRAKLAEQGGGS